jgi:hypothetical protein
MKLIPNWRKSWRMRSAQLSALGAALSATWLLMPAPAQAEILVFLHITEPAALSLAGFLAVLYGRLKAQPELHDKPPT